MKTTGGVVFPSQQHRQKHVTTLLSSATNLSTNPVYAQIVSDIGNLRALEAAVEGSHV